MSNKLNKAEIRQSIKWLWQISADRDIELRDDLAVSFVKEANFFKEALFVLTYCPTNYELAFLNQLLVFSPDKIYYFPKIIDDKIVFFAANNFDGFTRNAFGILEPPPFGAKLDITGSFFSAAVAFVPSVAADKSLNRLGRGKGYYDKFLLSAPAGLLKVSVLPDFCITSTKLPTEQHDQSLDMLVSVGYDHLEVISKS